MPRNKIWRIKWYMYHKWIIIEQREEVLNSEILYLPMKISTEINFPYLFHDFYFYLILSLSFPYHFTVWLNNIPTTVQKYWTYLESHVLLRRRSWLYLPSLKFKINSHSWILLFFLFCRKGFTRLKSRQIFWQYQFISGENRMAHSKWVYF